MEDGGDAVVLKGHKRNVISVEFIDGGTTLASAGIGGEILLWDVASAESIGELEGHNDGFVGTIGNTPLIRLKAVSEATGCTILGKAEFLNPGQSVKDRAALAIIEDAEKSGALRPGGTIVEGTAGNTGIGLALVGNARGYRTVIVIPDNQSQEKKDMCCACAARSWSRCRPRPTGIRTTM